MLTPTIFSISKVKTPILVLWDATGGEPQQVLQILPTTPAKPAASSRVSHARASLASQEEVRKTVLKVFFPT